MPFANTIKPSLRSGTQIEKIPYGSPALSIYAKNALGGNAHENLAAILICNFHFYLPVFGVHNLELQMYTLFFHAPLQFFGCLPNIFFTDRCCVLVTAPVPGIANVCLRSVFVD